MNVHVDMDLRQSHGECVFAAPDVPVLGLCFGGQMLASVLGGSVEPAPLPEFGWHRVTSLAPDVVCEGPWLQYHFDRFTLPPEAEELAVSPSGTQAFRQGVHLGVQFHPESTIPIVCQWVRADRDLFRVLGIHDGEAVLERGRRHAAAAVRAAFQPFDAFRQRTHH